MLAGIKDPEQMLEVYIHTFCKVMFGIEDEIDKQLAVLFSKEVANPSPFLDEMVERYIVPGNPPETDEGSFIRICPGQERSGRFSLGKR